MARERALSLLDFTLQFTHGKHVGRDISAPVLLNHAVSKIPTAEVSHQRGQYFEDAIIYQKKRNVESAPPTEVTNDELRFATLLIEAICDSGSRRLVDDTENLETGDCTAKLGSLTPCVVEI